MPAPAEEFIIIQTNLSNGRPIASQVVAAERIVQSELVAPNVGTNVDNVYVKGFKHGYGSAIALWVG